MKPLVSVIVPVYKVEDCLPRCLDSLCSQTLKDIEIILVDDASSDRCGAICEEYAAKDKRVKVLHHAENRGLAAARNSGMRAASADYLMFVDSDDYVHKDFCRLPYGCAVQNSVDLVMFRYQRFGYPVKLGFANNNVFSKLVSLGHKEQWEAIDIVLNGYPQAWNKLYKKTLFQNISYPEGYYFEDVGATHKVVWQASNIYFIEDVLYFKCYRDSSITTLKTEKAMKDWFQMCMLQYRDLAAWGYPSDKLNRLFYNILLFYCMKRKRDFSDSNYVYCVNALCSINNMPENFSWKKKVLIIILKYCPPLFELVCNLWGLKVY